MALDPSASGGPRRRGGRPETSSAHGRLLRWLIPALLAIAWLGAGAVAGPYAGKLSEVAENDESTFLPATAEATEVAQLRRAFTESEAVPAIVVAERESGLTEADLAYLGDRAATIAALDSTPEEAPPVIPSDEEPPRAAQIIVAVTGADPGDAAEAIRELLEEGRPDGLTVLLTGPAGQAADLGEAFSGVDGLLLVVAASVVAVILVLVYRSPLLPIMVLASGVTALGLASLAVYHLADTGVLDLNGQSQGILFILVFGAATDYALLLVARFREELRGDPDRIGALLRAWRGTIEPIAASAGTVILGVLCLLFSDLNSNRSLGPVAAIGIAAAFLASTTFLPALLALTGRAGFWPRRVAPADGPVEPARLWRRSAALVKARPRTVWVVCVLALAGAAAFMPQLRAEGTAQTEVFLTQADSVDGQRVLSEHFPGGSGSPTVIIARAEAADTVVDAAEALDGVADATVLSTAGGEPRVVDGLVEIDVTLADPADSEAAIATVRGLRAALGGIEDADARVGGATAVQLDTREVSQRDRAVIIPIVLAVILAVLVLLLRSLLAPVLLVATVVLSFAATMGVSALVFNHVLGFPGADPVVPLFGFVFLVALGIDYNIFLMTRAREEAAALGTREGTLRALVATGGVITSAGVVLAATFSALAVLPLLFLAQIAFIVAFGVILDALLVRTLVVPALAVDIGPTIWWPSRLSKWAGPQADAAGKAPQAAEAGK